MEKTDAELLEMYKQKYAAALREIADLQRRQSITLIKAGS